MITLNTLTSLIDDILLTIRNSNVVASESINRLQIEQWITFYRAKLIKEEIDREGYINPEYIQHIDNIHLEKVNANGLNDGVLNQYEYVTEIEIPKTITTEKSNGILSITDVFGNEIQLTSKTRIPRQKYRKYTCNDYLATIKDNKIYVYGMGEIEYINVAIVAENPADLNDCDFADKPYPIPAHRIASLKSLIINNEIRNMIIMPSDTVNNSHNDLQNINVRND